MTDTNDLVKRLRFGTIQHPKRWSGDTHTDLGGPVDEKATDDLMNTAADEITRLQAELDAANKQARVEALRDIRLIVKSLHAELTDTMALELLQNKTEGCTSITKARMDTLLTVFEHIQPLIDKEEV